MEETWAPVSLDHIFGHQVKEMLAVILFNQLLYYNSSVCTNVLDLHLDHIWRKNQPAMQSHSQKQKGNGEGEGGWIQRGGGLLVIYSQQINNFANLVIQQIFIEQAVEHPLCSISLLLCFLHLTITL